MSQHKRDDRGAAMVEFAIIVPVLLLILLGIIEFGRAYNTQVSIQAAAREGARELALRHPENVQAAVENAAPSVDIGTGDVTQVPCPESGGQASVTVSEPFTFMPFLDLIDTTLTATGVMRCGL